MTNISPEIVARMEALVRAVAAELDIFRHGDLGKWFALNSSVGDEAVEIVALLPEPVDPDLLDAREIVRQILPNWHGKDWLARVDRGEADESPEVRSVLFGIKRGRELAARERT